MTSETDRPANPLPDAVVTEERLSKAAEFIEEEEGATSRYAGGLAVLTTTLLVGMSLFHLYAAVDIVPAQVLRPVHVGWMLLLVFLLFPIAAQFRNRLMWWDVVLALLGVSTIVYLLAGGDDFWDRNTLPTPSDTFFGVAFVLLVLEAVRRTSGWIMVFVIGLFLAYAFIGPWLPGQWAHRGYDIESMTGFLYQTLEGIFGTAVDVSSSLIILFTIFGAFLQHSGAGKFFLDWSFAAMGGKPTGAGRTVVLASFLLGGPSGSGVATTVTIGSVAYPMLARAGYGKDAAGGLLAAGGLGAIISPPVLGAAAFLIAEFLKISYLDVLLMATVPTILYYLSLFVMVEIDARKFGMSGVRFERVESLWNLTKQYWFHFLSLVSIIVFMLMGYSPVMSVFWATVASFITSFLHRDCAMFSYDLFRGREPWVKGVFQSKFFKALEAGSTGVLNVAITCAGAGLIVGVVTLTGLGLKFSAFIIYYAVLSEVSPPTALSPFAAAAITRGDPYKTTLQSWKYTLPAFLVPFMFVLDPSGTGLLLTGSIKTLGNANWGSIAVVTGTAALGIAALAGGVQGWLFTRTNWLEKCLLLAAGLALVYPTGAADLAGFGCFALVVALQLLRKRVAGSTA